MSKSTIIPSMKAVAEKASGEGTQTKAIRAAAETIAEGAAAPSVAEMLRKAGVYLERDVTTKLQASAAAAGTLTVKEADKLLAGQSTDVRFRAKTALHRAGLLK